MKQIIKDKMEREILVVKNELLFANTERATFFYWKDECNFETQILENFEYMKRWIAETNFDYKQPIGYWIVVNEKDEIFVYKRWWANSNAWDSRLHNKIAIWVGGHIEREDEDSAHPIKDSLIREIEEEIDVSEDQIVSIESIGYINNEEDEVNRVHIGAAYIIRVKNVDIALLDWEIAKWEFVSVGEYEKMITSGNYDVENWSKFLLEPLKKYL